MTLSHTKMKLIGFACALITLVISTVILSSNPSSAQTRETEKTKKASTKSDAQADYKIGERLKPNKPSNSSVQNAPKDSHKDATGKPISFKTISWDDLIPNDWDPSADFKGMDMGNFSDADPRAISALKKLRSAWDNAPTNPSFNQKYVRIPGFVVPLDVEDGKVGTFLLVPYFGGCLHTPPPPANQIIEVQLEQAQAIRTMEPVWVSGQLDSVRSQTEMGTAGYRINAIKVVPYKDAAHR
jgi:hypothetical protein